MGARSPSPRCDCQCGWVDRDWAKHNEQVPALGFARLAELNRMENKWESVRSVWMLVPRTLEKELPLGPNINTLRNDDSIRTITGECTQVATFSINIIGNEHARSHAPTSLIGAREKKKKKNDPESSLTNAPEKQANPLERIANVRAT